MLDLGLGAFFAALMLFGFRRPFIWVLAYIYVDIVAPQKMSWGILASAQMSLIVFVAAFAGWLIVDDKRFIRFSLRQVLLTMLLIYCGITTLGADFPEAALEKWSWVWKAVFFGIFLPLTLTTRLRVEAAALFISLSIGAIIISGAIKTILGGGGYGQLKLFVNNNTGLYEGSTLSMATIAVIPLVIWLMNYGTIFKRNKWVSMFCVALVFSCLLIPVGTQTRTGLVCIGLLCLLYLRSVKYRFVYLGLMVCAAVVAIPFLPESYTQRMSLIQNHKSDNSASTRVAVWQWTIEYAKDHPFGGGFDAYRGNKIRVITKDVSDEGGSEDITTTVTQDESRAYHSSYFEMLGEQGYPGLLIWLLVQVACLLDLERISFRLRKSADAYDKADRAMAMALQKGHIIYLFGSLFVGIAFQHFILLLIGLQIGLTNQVRRRRFANVSAQFQNPQRKVNPLVPLEYW